MFNSWVKLLIILFFSITASAATTKEVLPQLIAEPVSSKGINFNNNEFMSVGSSESSPFGRLLWEEQDNIQRKILNSFGKIGFGFDLINKSINSDKINLLLGVEISPRRNTFPINFGSIKDGIPVKDPQYPMLDPKSGFLAVDTFHSSIHAGVSSTELLVDLIKTKKYPVGIGYGFEMGQIVRKFSLLRSPQEFLNSKYKDEKVISEKIKKQFDELNAASPQEQNVVITGLDENVGKFQSTLETLIKYVLNGIEFAYEEVENVIQKGASYFEDDHQTKIFFAGLFDSIRLKKDLFTVNAEKTLAHLSYGDVLSIIQYKNFGPNVGTSVESFDIGFAWKHHTLNREVRIIRLSPKNCGVQQATDGCNKVLVSLIKYYGLGTEVNVNSTLHWGIARYKPYNAHAADTNFYQVEWQIEFDLYNPKAVVAYNAAVKQYNPDMNQAFKMGKFARETGVRLVSYSVIGDSALMNKPFNDKSPSSKNSTSRLNLLLVANRTSSENVNYRRCETRFNENGKPINNNSEDQCSYNGLSARERSYTNRIDLRIKKLPFLDSILDFRAKQAEANMCEAFAKLDKRDVQHGVNLHCHYRISDKFPYALQYHDEYLRAVKTMLGMYEPEMISFYRSDASELYTKVMNGLSNERRSIDKKHQSLNVDVYMDEKYTDAIFKHNIEDVKGLVARILLGDGYTWKNIENLRVDAQEYPDYCQVNPRYEGMIITKYFDQRFMCREIKRMAFDMIKTYNELVKANISESLKTMMDYYSYNKRKPYIPLLLLLLGKDHSKYLQDGSLAINFYYESEDLNEKKEISLGNVEKLATLGFNNLPGVNPLPGPGRPRIYNVNVFTEKTTVANNDAHFYLEFYSDLKATPSNKPLRLSGYINEYKMVLADKPKATFEVNVLKPEEVLTATGDAQYRYVVKLSNLGAAGLEPNKSYIGVFNLEDPETTYPNGEYEHYSEMVEYLVRFKPKK